MPEPISTTGAPAQLPPISPSPMGPYGSDEILWFDAGRWGQSGYAIPNPGGKFYAINSTVLEFVQMMGRSLFEIMHREDRRFIKPLGKDILWDIHQLCILGRKRLSDRAVLPNESEFQTQHVSPHQEAFVLYPIPFFGDSVRNLDLRSYAREGLSCLAEAMQHSEADKTKEITAPGFAASMGKYLHRILFNVATKYFGYGRAEVLTAPSFTIPPEKWANFDYTKWSISHELTEERPDMGWIPTENDMRTIRGIPAPYAMSFAKSYPTGQPSFPGGPMESTGSSQPLGAPTGAFYKQPGPP